jgi:GNAT superfamily N-acetyltransferase
VKSRAGLRPQWTRELSTLWVCDLEQAAPALVSPRSAAIFQELEGRMREQLAHVMRLADLHVILERLQAGRRCFVATVEGRIVSYAWVSSGCEHVGELERVFVLPDGDNYLWDCATVPDQRGRRLYTALLSHTLAHLKGEGVRRVWIGASRANRFSTRGILRAGFSPALMTSYLRLGRLRYLRLVRPPSAPAPLVEDAVRLVVQRDERRIGSIFVGVGEPAALACVLSHAAS